MEDKTPKHRDPKPANQWHNAVPSWIANAASFKDLRHPVRATLQVMANRGQRPDASGSIRNIWGGRQLWDAMNISQSTFWRHLGNLEGRGFVVITGMGGKLRKGGKWTAHIYAIPGSAGCLTVEALDRRDRVMQHQGGGVYMPFDRFGAPHTQNPIALFSDPHACQNKRAVKMTEGEKTPPSVKMTQHLLSKRHNTFCQNDTTPSVKMTHLTYPLTSPITSKADFSKSVGGGCEPTHKKTIDPIGSPDDLAPDVLDQLQTVAVWLTRIGWRSQTSLAKKVALLKRNSHAAIDAFENHAAIAQQMRDAGTPPRDDAALFNSLFTGTIKRPSHREATK